MRLADGVLKQEGRVEVCVNGVWGSICGSGWDTIDGYVLCKQAGFDDEGFHICYMHFILSTNACSHINPVHMEIQQLVSSYNQLCSDW